MLNSSFNSASYSRNLSKIQQSILKEYDRLNFGEETIQYSIGSIKFDDLPENFPEEIAQGSRKCVRLSGCSFFEMLSYAVWEFLLSNKAAQKTEIIKKIKKQIGDKGFMEDCPSTKGLLLKGIKQMYDEVEVAKGEKLIAHCMWRTDAMMAFTEFWKALLAKLSVRNIVTADTTKSLDVGLFQLLADFLDINFTVYYETPNDFQKQAYLSRRRDSNLKLDIVVYSNDRNKKKECSRLLESSSMLDKSSIGESLEWSYIILEDTTEYYRNQLERQDISEIKAVDDSVQDEKQDLIKLLKLKTKSELNLQKLRTSQATHPHDDYMSPHSQIKYRGLQTTRTKKSRRTTDHKSKHSDARQSSIMEAERISFEETENHLEGIRVSMHLGEQLIFDMKEFCEKIRG